MLSTRPFYLTFLYGLLTLGGLTLLSGCIQTSMLPAHQLDEGENVYSLTLNVPPPVSAVDGYWPPPEPIASDLSGQYTTGLGGEGDLSVNLSAGYYLQSVGVAPRMYLSDNFNLQGQLRTGFNLLGEGFGPTLLTGGVQSVPSAEMPFYFGAYGGMLHQGPQPAPFLGGSIGSSFVVTENMRMQIEVDGAYPVGPRHVENPPARISVGVFGLFD